MSGPIDHVRRRARMSPLAAVAAAAAAVALLAPATPASAAGTREHRSRRRRRGRLRLLDAGADARRAAARDDGGERGVRGRPRRAADRRDRRRARAAADVAPSSAAAEAPPAPAAGRGHAFKSGTVSDPAAKGLRMHGRVFFKIPGVGLASCSGTAISSNRRNLVLTAGHCVNGGGHQGRWYTHWVFVPGYSHGRRPFGVWRAKRLYTTPIWVEYRDPDRRHRLRHRRRPQGTASAGRRRRERDQLRARRPPSLPGVRLPGQPARMASTARASATAIRICAPATDRPATCLARRRSGISCDMTEGASGGSWIAKQGYAVSVSSYYYPQPHDALFGPYFGSLAHELYAGTQIRCDGRAATIVGTGKADRLRGTSRSRRDRRRRRRRPDHRAGQARHRLRRRRRRPDLGGAGGDLLIGGAGNDHLVGGLGRDSCVGGSGRNRGAGCERRRGLQP